MEKRTTPANKLALKRVLAQDGNGRCADCKTATHPRWASWNIGILICIRCSGIHRSLGTHISKVRSIDLDTWNDQQLEKLLAVGNTRANAYWEAKLKPGYVPDESKIANFIKTKYELKRWVPEDDDRPLADVRPGLPPRVREDRDAGPKAQSAPASVDLLDLDGAFNVRSRPTTAAATPPAAPARQSPSGPFAFLHHNRSDNRHAPPPQQPQPHHQQQQQQQHHHHHHHHPHLHLPHTRSHHVAQGHGAQGQAAVPYASQQSAPVQPPPRPASQPPRSDLKKSILALYADKQPEKPLPRSPDVGPTNSSTSSLPASLSNLSFAPPQQNGFVSSVRAHMHPPFEPDVEDESFANVWK